MVIIWIVLMILSFGLGMVLGFTLLAKAANDGIMFVIFDDMKTIGDITLYKKYGKFRSENDGITEGLKTLKDMTDFLTEHKIE